jgi:hypothetical protein
LETLAAFFVFDLEALEDHNFPDELLLSCFALEIFGLFDRALSIISFSL